jgi:hypothetical protein
MAETAADQEAGSGFTKDQEDTAMILLGGLIAATVLISVGFVQQMLKYGLHVQQIPFS